ncbi:cytochrome bc1 complex diheme cytochrome c subunit [Amycolatopsis thermoflava]|uniref:cytochrome bc1 complex diheme cytochrome c subunit n=1 Tax=Amycolatopsis thermoflava TaxID=84480 RepID=UPI003EBA3EB7
MTIHRHRLTARARRAATAAVAGTVLAVPLGLTAAGAAPADPGQAPPPPEDRGQTLFQQSCASCHSPQGQGTQRGPSLSGVGEASVDFQLGTGRMPLRDETDRDPRHREPAFAPADIRALVDYVGTLSGGGPPIPRVRPGDIGQGQELFLTNCAACHSSTGRGSTLTGGQVAPDLFQATPVQVGEAIRVGPGLMPAYPETVLSPEQVNAIAGYVDTLQGEHGDLDRGGVSLGRLGPVAEGAVAWAVGLLAIVLVARWLGRRARE